MTELPQYLEKHCIILGKVFPNGISEEDIEILISLMHGGFSRRNLARLIADCLGQDYIHLYNIIGGVGYNEGEKNHERVEEIRTALIIHGYEGDTYW
jgi:hypothetical protein